MPRDQTLDTIVKTTCSSKDQDTNFRAQEPKNLHKGYWYSLEKGRLSVLKGYNEIAFRVPREMFAGSATMIVYRQQFQMTSIRNENMQEVGIQIEWTKTGDRLTTTTRRKEIGTWCYACVVKCSWRVRHIKMDVEAIDTRDQTLDTMVQRTNM